MTASPALRDAVEASRVEVGRPLALDPGTTSPVLASMARAWHGAMAPVERAALLGPVLPHLAGTRGSDAVEARRAFMAAEWAVRRYLPAWLHRAGLVPTASVFAAVAPCATSPDGFAAAVPALQRAAAEANGAWVAARGRAKAATPPDEWPAVCDDVREAAGRCILASAEASIRVPAEGAAWARAAHHLWEAAAACFWTVAWNGVASGTGSTVERVAGVVLPMRDGSTRAAMDLLRAMAAAGPAPRPAFHDPADFPALQALAAHWPAMRADLDELRAPVMAVDRVGKAHAAVVAEVGERVAGGEPFGWVKGWGGEGGGPNADWVQYGLVLGDRSIPFARAPRTLALLSGLRGLKVAAFARLAPGTLLPSHTHPEIADEGLLQAHVTLKAPRPCASCLLNVAGEVRQHAEGGLLVFDGSLPHWALNASDEDRVILYLEFSRAAFERPHRGDPA